jgi:hypothetical protein
MVHPIYQNRTIFNFWEWVTKSCDFSKYIFKNSYFKFLTLKITIFTQKSTTLKKISFLVCLLKLTNLSTDIYRIVYHFLGTKVVWPLTTPTLPPIHPLPAHPGPTLYTPCPLDHHAPYPSPASIRPRNII